MTIRKIEGEYEQAKLRCVAFALANRTCVEGKEIIMIQESKKNIRHFGDRSFNKICVKKTTMFKYLEENCYDCKIKKKLDFISVSEMVRKGL